MNTKLKFLDQKQKVGFCVRQGSENVKSRHSENASTLIIGTWNSALCNHFCQTVGRYSHFTAKLLLLEETILISICDVVV
jgi:hypothetical protein